MTLATRITPSLWFDDQAEPAAEFYVGIFDNSRMIQVARYSAETAASTGRPEGLAMTVAFQLDGLSFTALNGGPMFTFNQAISLQVSCVDQGEVDHYWDRLGEGGDPAAQRCGWLKDRYGLSWQIVPRALPSLLGDPDAGRRGRAMQAMMGMKKLVIAELERAAAG